MIRSGPWSAAMDVGGWLRSLGLGQYEAVIEARPIAFRMTCRDPVRNAGPRHETKPDALVEVLRRIVVPDIRHRSTPRRAAGYFRGWFETLVVASIDVSAISTRARTATVIRR